MGRYVQSQLQKIEDIRFLENDLFHNGIRCYQQALQLFENTGDCVNASVILCNICQFIRNPVNVTISLLFIEFSLIH